VRSFYYYSSTKKLNRPCKGYWVISRAIPTDVIEDLPLAGQEKSLPGRQKLPMITANVI
jgi:hypothetical protein